MKVLMLNGSSNTNGSTRAGLDIMAEVFDTEKIECEIVCVGAKPVRDCIGCGKCSEKGMCIFSDDGVNEFVGKATDADGFVFGTPVYYAHPSGRILSFLDRAFFSNMWGTGAAAFRHKPAAAIVVARRAGTSATYDVMNKYFGISQMLNVGSTYWNEFHALSREDVPKDAEGTQTLRNLARNMAWLMKCIKAGRDAGVTPPAAEADSMTNFVR
ncbi:MAG: flavodoxin family protein [Victivallales bacterium]|nr:flavodoxin family protein [Victivallales bacterium]